VKVTPTELPGVLVVEPQVFGDARGWFFESFHAARYAAHGIGGPFVQDNASRSARGILRGLHLQHPHAQGKLVSVADGAVLDVAVDVRVGSPSFGRWVAVELDAESKRQLWIPPGFAHGFYVLSEFALFTYKCTDYYTPEAEIAIAWDDPAIGIRWPTATPVLSPRDAAAPRLEALTGRLPRYTP
jgi:dTDP-4-dehydrorhamnose 3,5-epimerase